MFQPGSGSGILGVKWVKCNTSNLLSTPWKILFGMPPTSGKGQTQFFIQVPEKERKGLGRSGVSRGAIIACRSNTNKRLGPGSLQNSLLTLQQHHGCKKAGDTYGSWKNSEGNNQGNACTFLDPQTGWRQRGTVCSWPSASAAVSQMKSIITPKNPHKVHTH